MRTVVESINRIEAEPSRPLRVLAVHIANGYSPEAQVTAAVLRHASTPGGLESLVLHHVWPGDRESIGRFQESAGARVLPFDTGWRPNPDGRRSVVGKAWSGLRFRMTLPALMRAAVAYAPDVVYSTQQRWDCRAATHIAKQLGVPQIIHLHYIIGPWLGRDILDRLLTTDHVVAVSNFIRERAIEHGVAPDRATTIHNTLRPFAEPLPGTREAVRAELKLPLDGAVIGIVGRLDQHKGQADTIEAFARIAQVYSTAHLVIVGDGPARGDLERALAGPMVTFTGYLRGEALAEVYASADLFVFPSLTETFGQVALEAMASGLAVLGFDADGVRDLVRDGETGLLAPCGEQATFTRMFSLLLDEPQLRARMGLRARAAAEQRTWEGVMDGLLDDYERIIEAHTERQAA
jgi:glycosyltransferase involved in cell wall biosynthesis